MTRQNFTQGQAITFDDLNNISIGVEETLFGQTLRYLFEEQQGFAGNAFKATRSTGTTFTLGTGIGVYIDNAQATPESKYRIVRNDNSATLYTITNPHGTLSRRDIVQVRSKIENDATAMRDVKDGLGTVASTSVTIRKKWTFEIQIKDGTAASSPVAPAVDTGWVKIAELLISPGATGIANQAAITDSRTILKLLLEAYTDIAALKTRATNIETLNSSQGTELLSLDSRLDNVESVNTSQATSIANQATSIANQATAITNLQTADTSLDSRVDILEARVYESGFFTLNCSGFSGAAPQVTARYVRQGNLVTLMVTGHVGPSNATTLVLTGLPVSIEPKTGIVVPIIVEDNSGPLSAPGCLTIGTGDQLITIYKTLTFSSFAASGSKGFYGFSISYTLIA